MRVRYLFSVLLLSVSFFVMVVPGSSLATPSPLELQFGINSTDSPQVIAQKILPVLQVIEEGLEGRLQQPVKIHFKVFRTYHESIEAFVQGEIDFGRLGPSSYVLAKRKNPAIRLLAMENRKGKKSFQGLIVVRKERAMKGLSDLKGKRFAFGNKVSTIGRYLSQRELAKVGICAAHLAEHDYLQRHDNVFTAVASGRFDAGALKESTFYKRNKNNSPLKILHSFPNVTKPWLARAGLDEVVFNGLQSVILGLKAQVAFKKLKIEGFFPASQEDYLPIREAMLQVDRFESCQLEPIR
ncbi:MAG: PhnD/SsuA/transferrin family substrate-binding protein [Magnetococcales bacterium]|nr:PhnD/SsuA/transferrin family substrate-binding protein [Magnetococcales bacterium]